MSLEEPKFTLSLKDGAFELRDYAPSVVAEVTVPGDQASAGARGFRLLAGYIFGGNAGADKIAMTTPVTSIEKGEVLAMTTPVTQIRGISGHWLVRFTMPSAYKLADLPRANDARVQLRDLPGSRVAVLRFSGLTGLRKVAAQTALLLQQTAQRGLRATGPIALSRYNPPWTPWFLRRNEVMVPVAYA